MFFPDADGNPQIIDLTEPDPNMRFAFVDEDPDAKISLYFYDRLNRDTPKLLKKDGAGHRHNFTIIPVGLTSSN